MEGILFSSWNHEIIENSGRPADQWKKPSEWSLPSEFLGEKVLAMMGWNGMMVISPNVDVVDMTRAYLDEVQGFSCGKCVFCRIGTRVMQEVVNQMVAGKGQPADLEKLEALGRHIIEGSKCEIGQSAPVPVLHAISHYREAFLSVIEGKRKVQTGKYRAAMTAPCMDACPVHLDVPSYVELIKERRFEASLALIRKRNALPGVCGRVCVRPCEFACRRNQLDEPVQIKFLKRFVADYEIERRLDPPTLTQANRPERVAIIGAGPAGVSCAYYLKQRGYPITMFEALPEPGGMAAVGIPDYRLPRPVLRREIEVLKESGVEIIYNTRIGVDQTLDDLWQSGYQAIFAGIGSHLSRDMMVEGEKEGYQGFVHGIRFLRDVNLGQKIYPGKKLVVVGGGNVAIDCARSAFRVGFEEVNLVYRRSRREMPADKVEIEDAEKEGVKFHFLTLPTRVLAEDNKVTAVQCIRMELGEPDASGRRRPIPVKGSEFLLETDVVIPAIGQTQDLSFVEEGDGILVTKYETIKVDETSLMTDRPGVFSGGDCVSGPSSLVNALAAGYDAAIGIDRYLRKEPLALPFYRNMEKFVGAFKNYSKEKSVPALGGIPKSPIHHLPAETRIRHFDEVESGFDPEAAIRDASRCLRCYRVVMIATEQEP